MTHLKEAPIHTSIAKYYTRIHRYQASPLSLYGRRLVPEFSWKINNWLACRRKLQNRSNTKYNYVHNSSQKRSAWRSRRNNRVLYQPIVNPTLILLRNRIHRDCKGKGCAIRGDSLPRVSALNQGLIAASLQRVTVHVTKVGSTRRAWSIISSQFSESALHVITVDRHRFQPRSFCSL